MLIRESYKNYAPSLDFKEIVSRLLVDVPEEFKGSLEAIVLGNSSSRKPNKSRIRSKGRKVEARSIAGLYHQSKRSSRAWIEIYVDNVFPEYLPSWLIRFPFVQDIFVGKTLFHEIGHHIDYTTGRGKNREASAESWSKKLARQYMRKHHRRKRPIVKAIVFLLRTVTSLARKITMV